MDDESWLLPDELLPDEEVIKVEEPVQPITQEIPRITKTQFLPETYIQLPSYSRPVLKDNSRSLTIVGLIAIGILSICTAGCFCMGLITLIFG